MEISVNGVEILAAQEVAIEYNFNSTVFWIIFGVVCSIFIIAGICESIKYCNWIHLGAYTVIGLIIGSSVGVSSGFIFATSSKYETQYKVIISDEVLMNEFNKKYEIVEQEGKIYTVRERS